MKKYVLYNWHSDNGKCSIGICYAKDFTTNIGYYENSGYHNCHSHFLVGFDSVDEAVKYLRAIYNLYDDEMEVIKKSITYRLYRFHYVRGEYKEAQKFQC
jgi:hypothetical protein|nr:MAG TPA: hypothetical protein [Caudoviricetes sp.]